MSRITLNNSTVLVEEYTHHKDDIMPPTIGSTYSTQVTNTINSIRKWRFLMMSSLTPTTDPIAREDSSQ